MSTEEEHGLLIHIRERLQLGGGNEPVMGKRVHAEE